MLLWKGDIKQQKVLNKKIMVSCKWIVGYLMSGYIMQKVWCRKYWLFIEINAHGQVGIIKLQKTIFIVFVTVSSWKIVTSWWLNENEIVAI